MLQIIKSALGRDDSEVRAIHELTEAGVPLSDSPCRSCADPCDEGHEEYEKRLMVDRLTDMRGSVKPYRRQVVISTGKADWAHEVTDVDGSLAKYLSNTDSRLGGSSGGRKSKGASSSASGSSSSSSSHPPAGVFTNAPNLRLSIVNGSHRTLADDQDTHATVLILPDYVAIPAVPISAQGADALWRHACDPAVKRAGTSLSEEEEMGVEDESLKTWPIPYNCVILLCSHKKRDARCHIAAQRLEADFAHTLRTAGWTVDTDLSSEDLEDGPSLETRASSNLEREAAARAAFQALNDAPEKRALVLKNSHIGGHKYAGNVIIYFPQGISVWYGRVSPHEVDAVVKQTIIGGKILPALLRGGMNISKPGCTSLLDW